MKKYINYAIATTLASIGATAVGVALIQNLVLAAVWATTILVVHSVVLVLFGYFEIMTEFGVNRKWNKQKSSRR